MKLKKLTACIGLALGLGFGGAAVAAPTYFFPGTTIFEDDLLDFLVDRNGDTLVSVGDSVVTPLELFVTTPGSGGSSVAITPPEFTGIVDAFVLTKTPAGPPGAFNFTFGPNPAGFLDADGVAGGAKLGPAAASAGAPTGTIVRFFDGPLADLDVAGPNCISLADCLTRASNGTLYFGYGFEGAPNEHFSINGASDNPAIVRLFAASSVLGTAGFAFSQLENFSGVTFEQVDCGSLSCPIPFGPQVDLLGSGTINGGKGLPASLVADGAFARGDFQFELQAVPEPGTLALLGLGLAGVGFGAIRRRKFSVVV